MKCEDVRFGLSQALDGELDPSETTDIEEHMATCEACAGWLAKLEAIRNHLRYEPVADVPDVADRVLAAVGAHPGRRVRWMSIAALFIAGIIAGVSFIGVSLRRPARVAAAEVPELVQEAQGSLTSLSTGVHVVERGWHPAVAVRTFSGHIVYEAPESLWLRLRDLTDYPSDAWVPNDTELVINDDIAWSSGPAGCPVHAQPHCTPSQPRTTAIVNREPFPDQAPPPLDLAVPAQSFNGSGPPEVLGTATAAGRTAIGVAVTAAQVDPLLTGLFGTGNWRAMHPTDRVELWLDEDALVPIALVVRPNPSADRRLWAARLGLADPDGLPIFEVTWSEVVINSETGGTDLPPPPGEGPTLDAGFRDLSATGVTAPIPSTLPTSMTPHRTGLIEGDAGPEVAVRTWTDGRAWLKVSSTTSWPGGRLFGNLGDLVRRVVVGDGVAYLSEDGRRVGLHTEELDVSITGSLPTDDLLQVAAGLGVSGRPVPVDWAEAASSNASEALAMLPGLLLPTELVGFPEPSIHVEDDLVTVSFAGPGSRAFLLTEAPSNELAPPFEADVRGVTLRDTQARFTPSRGILEWIEDGLIITLRSQSLSLDELVSIAESLDHP